MKKKIKINLILQLYASQSVLIVKIVYGLSTNNQAYTCCFQSATCSVKIYM